MVDRFPAILGYLHGDTAAPEIPKYAAFQELLADPNRMAEQAFVSIARRRDQVFMAQYDKGQFVIFRDATTAAHDAKTAYTLALQVPVAEDADNVLREQRIALTLQIWNASKESLQKITDAQTLSLTPLLSLAPLFRESEYAQAAATARNGHRLLKSYEGTIQLPPALCTIFDDALNTLVITAEKTTAKMLLLRLQDTMAVRAFLFPDMPVLSEGAQSALYVDMLRRAHTGAGLQIKQMDTMRKNACLGYLASY